jgi:hypothetical protein
MNTITSNAVTENTINPITNRITIRNTTPAPRNIIPEAPSMEQQDQHHDQTTTPAANRAGFFVYPESIVNEGVNDCKKIIIRKLITEKSIHVSSIQNGLESIWGPHKG